jgi:hypothetical protein
MAPGSGIPGGGPLIGVGADCIGRLGGGVSGGGGDSGAVTSGPAAVTGKGTGPGPAVEADGFWAGADGAATLGAAATGGAGATSAACREKEAGALAKLPDSGGEAVREGAGALGGSVACATRPVGTGGGAGCSGTAAISGGGGKSAICCAAGAGFCWGAASCAGGAARVSLGSAASRLSRLEPWPAAQAVRPR